MRIIAFILFVVALLPFGALADSTSLVQFNRDVLPILSEKCFECHGPDAAQRKGDLRLDTEDGAKAEVLVPGDADTSLLLHRISSDNPDDLMPPTESGKSPLSESEITIIRSWINQGAQWTEFWAFTAPDAPSVPGVENPDSCQNPIDNFVQARLAAVGLAPAPEADRETLLRRLSFDLTGLPPTVDEMDAFLEDDSPEAYEKVVDRLLASPHYGERMAINWLDGARYADTNGFQNDFSRDMWPWRDWVIKAFNDNMPYDQFALEQIAGDMLPDATQSQRIASGFNRNNRSNTEGGSIEDEWRVENVIDRIEATSTVFLGLTMGCARCHDHKYDPMTQKEFYQFFAFFNSTADKGFYEETRGNAGPMELLPTEENKAEMEKLDGRVAEAKGKLVEAESVLAQDAFEPWTQSILASSNTKNLPIPQVQLSLLGNAPEGLYLDSPLGPAQIFTGAPESHIDLGQSFSFDKDKPYSVSVWVRPETGGAIYSKMDDASDYRGVDILLTDDGVVAVHMIHQWKTNAIKVFTDQRLTMNAWNHLFVRYDASAKASGIAVYINGVRSAQQTEIDTLTENVDTTESLRIGRRPSEAYFKGSLADLQIFGVSLEGEFAVDLRDAALARALRSELSDTQREALHQYHATLHAQDIKSLQDRVQALERQKDEYIRSKVASTMIMEELPEPRPTYLLVRGAYDAPDKSEALAPAIPAFLPTLLEESPKSRLDLAKWIAHPENPLTARVMVNRLWAKFFGHGIVKSQDNFGIQSDPPSHPELLDWMAAHFVETGWDLKAFQKLIVLSATYRQSSAFNDELLAKDSENKLYARGPRFRLPAELVRDNALALSGLLTPKIGGPSVMPYQPEGLWAELAGGAGQGPYIQAKNEDLYRRSLYTYRKRTVPHPTLTTFDAPSFEICQVKRSSTNTPLQALALLNDVTYVEAARGMAERILSETPARNRERVQHGFRLATGRFPNQAEEEMLMKGLEGYYATFKENPAAAQEFVSHGESKPSAEFNEVQLGAYTAFASVLLNLDETLTKE